MTEQNPTPTGEEVAAAVERLTTSLEQNPAFAMKPQSKAIRTILAALTEAQADRERLKLSEAQATESALALADKLCDAEATGSRQAAAVQAFCDGVESATFIDRRVKALAKRLRAAIAARVAEAAVSRQTAEIERLRAALGRIENRADAAGGNPYGDIARAALASSKEG